MSSYLCYLNISSFVSSLLSKYLFFCLLIFAIWILVYFCLLIFVIWILVLLSYLCYLNIDSFVILSLLSAFFFLLLLSYLPGIVNFCFLLLMQCWCWSADIMLLDYGEPPPLPVTSNLPIFTITSLQSFLFTYHHFTITPE